MLLVVGDVSLGFASEEMETSRLFQNLDSNRDGNIARGELEEEHWRLFQRLVRTSDFDGDGQLSASEFHAGLQPQVPPPFISEKPSREFPGANALLLLLAKMDANSDGKITKAEVPPSLREVFQKMENRVGGEKDGRLDRRELLTVAPQLAQLALTVAQNRKIDVELELALLPEKQWQAVQKLSDPKYQARELLADPGQAEQLFRRLDSNGDEEISKDEVPQSFADRFEKLISQADRNNNGRLELGELRAFSRRLRTKQENQVPPEQIEKDIQRFLKKFDKNKDGRIIRKELPKRIKDRFARLDGDGNGHLDRKELTKSGKELRALWRAENAQKESPQQ